MPWTEDDAGEKNHNVKTPKERRMWKDIANQVLKDTGDEGRAIREANGIIRKRQMRGGIHGAVDYRSVEED